MLLLVLACAETSFRAPVGEALQKLFHFVISLLQQIKLSKCFEDLFWISIPTRYRHRYGTVTELFFMLLS